MTVKMFLDARLSDQVVGFVVPRLPPCVLSLLVPSEQPLGHLQCCLPSLVLSRRHSS